MTERLAHRDLRNRSAEILRQVAAGASYEITNHGEVVAVLSPPPSDGGRLRVRKASVSRGFSDLEPVRRTEHTSVALDELRGE